MDVARLTTTTVIGNRDVPRTRANRTEPAAAAKERSEVPVPEVDKKVVQAALDRVIRNTRFQYIIKDELDYFVVRIIDKDTDKIIREIPSKELQNIHEGIEEAIGLLFDREI